MSGEAKKRRFWIGVACVVGFMAVMDLLLTPLYQSASANVKYGILTAAAIAIAVLLVWLFRATLRD